ncbi:unnamed protein product [Ambrosiozyma monospora]|uniref:Unnamed protein product n=1 Tax=Ambrosiozyma monospora TaxID=43982 RepID=A0ACB5UC89_AMBMO|nr:unnamed protein product [Ambrosiozyma monospora]
MTGVLGSLKNESPDNKSSTVKPSNPPFPSNVAGGGEAEENPVGVDTFGVPKSIAGDPDLLNESSNLSLLVPVASIPLSSSAMAGSSSSKSLLLLELLSDMVFRTQINVEAPDCEFDIESIANDVMILVFEAVSLLLVYEPCLGCC